MFTILIRLQTDKQKIVFLSGSYIVRDTTTRPITFSLYLLWYFCLEIQSQRNVTILLIILGCSFCCGDLIRHFDNLIKIQSKF